MNTTRERLEELLKRAKWASPYYGKLVIDDRLIELLEKLIAERPYEPGDKIRVGNYEDCPTDEAIFFCVHPDDNTLVLAQRYCDEKPYIWRYHKPLPKTYRVTVPEEIIKAAEQVRSAPTLMGRSIEARLVTDWLANPDNWEK